ncbi:hypothetical protein GF371_04965 [Candidatus Woesearchaeota archaeon]|nr:hypothetical protein [Candidatus Woesearchaeota archaeon]
MSRIYYTLVYKNVYQFPLKNKTYTDRGFVCNIRRGKRGFRLNGSPKRLLDHTTPLTHPILTPLWLLESHHTLYKKEALSQISNLNPLLNPFPKEPSFFFIIMSLTYSSISIVKGVLVSAIALLGENHKQLRKLVDRADRLVNKFA